MKVTGNHVFAKADAVLEESLNQRLIKQNVITSNISNAQTPGYRSLGYEFEEQLRAAVGNDGKMGIQATDARHFKHQGLTVNGDLRGDLHVKPTESIGNDGNTVDLDSEMADLAWNQTLYRATVELLNRRLAMLKYGINGGR
ncbi:MAG: flagellar basal body rod protein FlgB [Proteobacteria bacterium]|jgi:flagellar basal-body rod protein FlgB|nr:flagellar basal body rod protein FlgB [Pseudomonadota bacterium]